MILTLCKKCGKFLPEGETLYPVTIDEGNGLVSHMDVCQSCYCIIQNDNDSKLLLENA